MSARVLMVGMPDLLREPAHERRMHVAKLKHVEVARVGDQRTVSAMWHNGFKKPVAVKVSIEKTENPGASVLIQGDAKEVDTTLAGLATIAWNLGWRPRGLMSNIAAIIDKVKEPTS